jgi:hypothetical protein
MNAESWRGKTYTVSDPDARLRKPDALHEYRTKADGSPERIAQGAKVRVTEVRIEPTGAKTVNLFVNAEAADGSGPLGWTSVGNLEGGFLSETLGAIPPAADAKQDGPNAAWQDGAFLGQVTLVKVAGTRKEIEYIAESTCDKFLAMVDAARREGIAIGINSGFRSFPEQKHLHDGFTKGLPGFNPANRPGNSNHQNGLAFDIDVGGGTTTKTYLWLAKNATGFGFLRTVSRESWHWEYLPAKAAAAKARGVHSTFD